jgi:hypothetical protein
VNLRIPPQYSTQHETKGLSEIEWDDMFVGDRYNHAVRMIQRSSGIVGTIAGRRVADSNQRNDVHESNPLNLNLPEIASMDYHRGHLLVPTNLTSGGELAVLYR